MQYLIKFIADSFTYSAHLIALHATPVYTSFLLGFGQYSFLANSISSIFDKCSILEQTIWLSNHTSHTEVYFNDFFANALCDNMGMIIFDL